MIGTTYNVNSGVARKGSINGRLVAGAMAVVFAGSMLASLAVSAATQPTNYTELPFTEAEVADWEVDRAVPSGGYESVDGFAGRDDVLEMRIDGSDRNTGSSFYYTEGLKRDADGAQTARADVYVDSAWLATDVRAGLWGVGNNEADAITAYPIVEFTTAGEDAYTGWRVFNDQVGGWTYLPGVSYNTDEWNTVEVSFNPDTTVFDIYINDELVGSSVATGSVDLGSVILNSYNYGSTSTDYDVRWSNFALGNYVDPPTSKADCKKGGYAAFGFKNQGQCVASVQSNGNSKHNR